MRFLSQFRSKGLGNQGVKKKPVENEFLMLLEGMLKALLIVFHYETTSFGKLNPHTLAEPCNGKGEIVWLSSKTPGVWNESFLKIG